MNEFADQNNSKNATPNDTSQVLICGHLTQEQFDAFLSALETIGTDETCYLFGYPVWQVGEKSYVFVGDGVSP